MPWRTRTSCDSITRHNARRPRAEPTREVTMNVETLEHPIESQSAIAKGN
jgi:hypothetical protein